MTVLEAIVADVPIVTEKSALPADAIYMGSLEVPVLEFNCEEADESDALAIRAAHMKHGNYLLCRAPHYDGENMLAYDIYRA